MTRPTELQTSDIDLAAAIMTGTGKQPGVYQQPGQQLVTFEFVDTDAIRSIIMEYATGELVQPVKRFSASRAWLYRQAKAVRP